MLRLNDGVFGFWLAKGAVNIVVVHTIVGLAPTLQYRRQYLQASHPPLRAPAPHHRHCHRTQPATMAAATIDPDVALQMMLNIGFIEGNAKYVLAKVA